MLEYILPVDGSDHLTLTRTYMAVTAVALLLGRPILAGTVAGGTVYFLQDDSGLNPKRNSQLLEYWLLLSTLSTAASIGSWILLFLSSRQAMYATSENDNNATTQTWLFGMVLQKAWSLILGFLIYKDIELEIPKVMSGIGRGRKKGTEDDDDNVDGHHGGGGEGEHGEGHHHPTAAARQRRRRRCSLGIEFLEVRVRVLQGRDLVSRDVATAFLFGKPATTDPYVVVSVGPNEMGRTSVATKTVNPVWAPQTFQTTIKATSVQTYKVIECKIYDRDPVKEDEPMGTVYIPIPRLQNIKMTNWFPVRKGTGDDFCSNAKGQLLVEVESIFN